MPPKKAMRRWPSDARCAVARRAPSRLSGTTTEPRPPCNRRMAKATGSRSVNAFRSAASVPIAGQMIRPAAPCSRISRITWACRTTFSPVLAMNGTTSEVWQARSMPIASSMKNGLARSLMTMPSSDVRAERRLAAPRW